MATVNELTVKISADVKTAIDGLNKATDSLKDFGANGAKSISEVNAALAELRKQRNIATTSEEVNRLNKAIKDLSAEAARLRKPAEELGKKILPQVAQGSSQANFALTNTGRVLQDLPFGAIGVANNLEPLVQSFVQLRKESGSVKGAISALAGSLLGGGGLVLAISLVSAGLSLWGQRQQKLNREAKEGAEQANKYAEELAKERVQLDLLFKAATSANVPLSKRKEAIKELRSQYGEYLKDFSNEEILAGKAASAYNQLANAITQAARARALQERITENERKALELEIKATEEALAVRNKANAQKNETIRISGGVGAAVEVEVKAVDKQRDIYRQGAKAIRDYTNEAKELREENLRLANQYTKTLPAAFTATEKAQKSQSEKAKKSAKETSAFFGTLGTKDLPKVTSGIDKL
ncbi:hypothetical protein FJZ26_05600, partial [Candidatus Parvarchaeota archaeon]|nr:hypothetical protein [Candidatus Parvarchaeota archaeon]